MLMVSSKKHNIGSETAEDCRYLSLEQAQKLNGSLSEIGRMINSMIEKADIFCDKRFSTTDD